MEAKNKDFFEFQKQVFLETMLDSLEMNQDGYKIEISYLSRLEKFLIEDDGIIVICLIGMIILFTLYS